MKNLPCILVLLMAPFLSAAQERDSLVKTPPIITPDSVVTIIDTIGQPAPDTTLRIINLNPYVTLHADSTLSYAFETNRTGGAYFWYLKNAPVGIRIHKNTGLLSFKAEKAFFLSGRLKYDQPYKVMVGVQNVTSPADRADTSFTILFYNTEVIPSLLKPGVAGTIYLDEGDTLNFPVLCETGNFPIDNILTLTNIPITNATTVNRCGDVFSWSPGYEFVRETDSARVKILVITFISSTRYKQQDTALVRVIVRNGLNYPLALVQHAQVVRDLQDYILQLKFTFMELDKTIKKTKKTRTVFDLTAAGTALTGTILSTSSDDGTKRTGAIMPGFGIALTPIKEAVAPNKNTEQNQATLLRSSIKRLEYILRDHTLVGERDPEIAIKTAKLKEELKQSQLQLIDVPLELGNSISREELDRYFNSQKVNKKYRLRRK